MATSSTIGTPRRRHEVTHVPADERTRVFRQAKRHSRSVRILRVVLPVASLLSMGFYFTKARVVLDVGGGKVSGEIPTFSGDNLKMANPRYEGFTNDHGKYYVKAVTGFQDFRNPSRIKLQTIESHLTQEGEQWAHLVSNDGIYDSKSDLLELEGKITVTSSNGMTAHLKTATIQTKTQIVTSKDPVIVEMATGTTVESDGMELNAKTKEIVFTGNVRSHLVRSAPAPAGEPRQRRQSADSVPAQRGGQP